MKIQTLDGIDIFVLPDNAVCYAALGKSPIDLDECPTGCDICLPEGCINYDEVEIIEDILPGYYYMELISREAVIGKIRQAYGDSEKNGLEYAINALPTMERRPKAKWHIEPGIGRFCTNCAFDIGEDLDYIADYCPVCGAKMEGEE